MKNIYFNRLQKKRNKENNNSDQTTIPLKQYINNGNRLNSFSGLNKIGVNRSSNFKNENKSNNNLINSYNQSIIYLPNYKNRNDLRHNNHSLFDSNKQQIINIDENNNYIRFESYNIEKEKENKNRHLSRNNSIFNSSNNNNSKNIGKNYSYQKNYFNNNITNINYNINIQNFTVKKNNNNTSNDSNNNIYYSNNNNKTNKYISHIKDDLSNKSNNFSNYKNNYNFTEINYTNKNKNKNETNIVVKNKRKEPMKRNLTENNHLKRKCKESEKDKDKEKNTCSSSIIKLQVYNLKQEKKEPINNKKVNNIREINNKLPIKLNIEDINKEKLSRLKRIIEQGSTNIKNYKMEISKNLVENNAKTPNKTYNKKKVNNTQYIFKKKKINVIKKEESKEGNININPQKIDNNYLTKSSIKNTNKRPLILNAQLQQTNYKIKSGLKTNNYFLHKEKKNVKPEINKENKYQGIKYNEMVNNNNNNDDTISLSYSKEQNISFFSKKIVPNEKSLFLPFLIEQFFLYYNKLTKDLIITDKNKKNKEINNESDDDDYQLTKEIILLKRGLTAKSELSKKLVKKMRQMRIQRVCNMNLFGNKKIYKKKMSS